MPSFVFQRRRGAIAVVAGLAAAAIASAAQPQAPDATPAAPPAYARVCAACHGTRLQGGQGPSLLAQNYRHGPDDASVARSIRDGYPSHGMPAWGSILSAAEIKDLVGYIRVQREQNSPAHLKALDQAQIAAIPKSVIKTELEQYRLEVLGEVGMPFGMAFLPDGRLLVTEQYGGLRILDHERLLPEPVQGVPVGKPIDIFKRLLLDVAVPPDYARTGWIYITRGDSTPGPDGRPVNVVRLERGRLRGNRWIDSQRLATIPLDTTATARLAFDHQGHVYVTTSSEGRINEATSREPYTEAELLKTAPQDLSDPAGKILRFDPDGGVPPDNPFVGRPGALGSIWSLGHRNPQGVAFDPRTGLLWSTEHGPRGGDELNLIRPGHNYGWPVISYGTRYDGIAFTTEVEHAGMDQPVLNWTPSIAVSAIAFYEGAAFPRWRGDLFIGSLMREELIRVRLAGEAARLQEVVLHGIGRIRALAVGPDGDIYLALELKQEGVIVRMRPA